MATSKEIDLKMVTDYVCTAVDIVFPKLKVKYPDLNAIKVLESETKYNKSNTIISAFLTIIFTEDDGQYKRGVAIEWQLSPTGFTKEHCDLDRSIHTRTHVRVAYLENLSDMIIMRLGFSLIEHFREFYTTNEED